MAETLINPASDTGGGDTRRYLKAKQQEIVEAWMNHALALPPERAVAPAGTLTEVASLLPAYLDAVLERVDPSSGAQSADGLRPIAERASAAGISARSIDRSLTLLREVAAAFMRGAPGAARNNMQQTVLDEIEACRSDLIQLCVDATLSRLRDAEDKYLGFMKNAGEAMLVCDAETGAIHEANRKAEEVTGYKTGILVGMTLADLEDDTTSGSFAEACGRAVEDNRTVAIDNLKLTRRDGQAIAADVRISPFPAESTARRSVLVSMRDMTCERELERRMHSFSEQLNRTASEKTEEIAALTRITSAISSGADIEKIFQIVVFEIGKLVRFDSLSIMLIEDDGRHYRVAASAGRQGRHLSPESPAPVKGSLMERTASERRPLLGDHLAPDEQFEEVTLLREEGLNSFICSPLMTGDRLVGALLLCSRAPDAFGERDVSILQDISEEVAVALQWVSLRDQERRRRAEMKIINEVGREAMSTLDLKTLLTATCQSIHRNLPAPCVSIYLTNWDRGVLERAAYAPEDSELIADGCVPLGEGVIGEAAGSGEPLLINDLSKRPDVVLPRPGGEGSILCVPIKIGGRVDGVMYVRSGEPGAFEQACVNALETLADLVARGVEKSRLYQRTSSLRELNENIIATMPSALLVLDQHLNVLLANAAYCKLASVKKEDVIGKPITSLWDENFLRESRLLACMKESLIFRRSCVLKNRRYYRPGRRSVLNFAMNCITAGEHPRLLLMIEDVTDTVERAFRLSMLREMNEAIQGTLELDKILRLVLTCVTAGHALGFNRGFLLMVNKEKGLLEGTTGIGPVSLDDARNIYSDETLKSKSLQQVLAECDFSIPKEELPLYDLARQMVFSLDEDEIVVRTVREKKRFLVLDARNDERVSKRFREMIGSNSFVSVPLVAKDEVIGVILADNLYSGHPITDERAELLALFANHAGLAIENGESYARLQEEIKDRIEAYHKLEEMQESQVRTGQLAAIGEMAARVAHEIRNPLVNIGLLARQIVKSLEPSDPRHEKAGVIVSEVMRLERILTDVVDFSKPATPNKLMMNIDSVVDNITDFVRPQLSERNIELVRVQETPLPQILADPGQLKQALLNIVKNAIEAVDSNGRITITTKCKDNVVSVDVADTGPGIMDYVLENMYDLFYTTKPGGSGLGLAITRKIIEDHRGKLDVHSTPGGGTTFRVQLPLLPEGDAVPPAQAPEQGGPQL